MPDPDATLDPPDELTAYVAKFENLFEEIKHEKAAMAEKVA